MNTLLFQRFTFTKRIEIIREDNKREIVPLRNKTVIRADHDSLVNDLAELLAGAKLAEQNPLLIQFAFHKDCTAEENEWIAVFQNLCQPLESAWIWKIMRRYVPEEYTEKIEILRAKWESYYEAAHTRNYNKAQPVRKQDFLITATILYENPVNETDFTISSRIAQEEWDAYIDQIKKLSRMEPDPYLYLTLPDLTDVPFSVGIKVEDGLYHYLFRSFC